MILALVAHRFDLPLGSQHLFVFSSTEPLKEGDVVLCDTCKGKQMGLVAMDSEDFTETGVKMFMLQQQVKEIKPILGKFVLTGAANELQ